MRNWSYEQTVNSFLWFFRWETAVYHHNSDLWSCLMCHMITFKSTCHEELKMDPVSYTIPEEREQIRGNTHKIRTLGRHATDRWEAGPRSFHGCWLEWPISIDKINLRLPEAWIPSSSVWETVELAEEEFVQGTGSFSIPPRRKGLGYRLRFSRKYFNAPS